ncbi:hypothetical protein [Sphingobium cloacae]|uniref:hypothetical protein n=1 Tax=Sphingobium cloacae TaxID=120107 RepID=UPI000830BD52|nr:hypothetical protein [Sphingobium cloacae]
MPVHVWVIDLFGVALLIVGFTMAFRQDVARRIIGKPHTPAASAAAKEEGGDPLTYILRIAGVMLMVFGFAIGLMFTLFNLS